MFGPSFASTRPRQWYDPRTYRPDRRTFSAETKRLAWRRCNRQCQGCTAPVTGAGDIVFDHIVPWELTHDSTLKNCQVLCLTCDRLKTHSRDLPAIAEADRKADFHLGIRGPGRGRHPMACGRNSDRTKTFNAGVQPRLSQAEKHRRFIQSRFGGDNEIPECPGMQAARRGVGTTTTGLITKPCKGGFNDRPGTYHDPARTAA